MGFFFDSGLFEIVFFAMFIAVFGIIIVNIIRGVGEWNNNNHSPRLTVEATVVSKRLNVSYHQHGNISREADIWDLRDRRQGSMWRLSGSLRMRLGILSGYFFAKNK